MTPVEKLNPMFEAMMREAGIDPYPVEIVEKEVIREIEVPVKLEPSGQTSSVDATESEIAELTRVTAKPKHDKQWMQDMERYVNALQKPTKLADFVWMDWMDFLFNRWDKTPMPVVAMCGPRATGKSTAAMEYCARTNRSMLYVNCTESMDESVLLGTSRIRPAGKGGMSLEDYYNYGPLVVAAKLNCVLFLDEWNTVREGKQTCLNALTDLVAKGLYIPYTGEWVRWERPKIIMAFNAGYSGTKELQQALLDRVEVCQTDYLPADAEIGLICGRTKVSRSVAEKIVKLANAIRDAMLGKGNNLAMDFDLGPRALLSYSHRIMAGQDSNRAWWEAVINRVGTTQRSQGTRETVVQLSKQLGGFDFTRIPEAARVMTMR